MQFIHRRQSFLGSQLHTMAEHRCLRICQTRNFSFEIDFFFSQQAFRCIGRHFACHAEIHGSTEGINIGPRPQTAAVLILFNRGIALLQYGFRRSCQWSFCISVPYISDCAKVQQFHSAIWQHHNIIGANISMNQTYFMHFPKGIDHRLHQRKGLCYCQFPTLCCHILL